jgi:hypothetical protein
MLILIEGTGKNQLQPGQGMMLLSCRIVLFYEILGQNRPVCWSIVVKEKPTVGSLFFGAFLSDRIPNATKNVNVHFFIHSSNSSQIYQRIPVSYNSEFWERFEITT